MTLWQFFRSHCTTSPKVHHDMTCKSTISNWDRVARVAFIDLWKLERFTSASENSFSFFISSWVGVSTNRSMLLGTGAAGSWVIPDSSRYWTLQASSLSNTHPFQTDRTFEDLLWRRERNLEAGVVVLRAALPPGCQVHHHLFTPDCCSSPSTAHTTCEPPLQAVSHQVSVKSRWAVRLGLDP